MTQPTFEQEIELAKDQFKAFRLTEGGMGSLARLSTPDGEVLVALNLPDADMRSAALCQSVLESKATRVVWFSDTWVKVFRPDEEAIGRPSDYADRTEALMVTLITPDEARLVMLPYDVDGGEIIFGELQDMSEGAVGTHQEIQAALREVAA